MKSFIAPALLTLSLMVGLAVGRVDAAEPATTASGAAQSSASAALPALPAAASSAAAPGASAPQNTVRPQFAAPFAAAQELMKNKNGAQALVKLKEIEALGSLSPYEHYLLTRVRAAAEYGVGDFAGAAKNFELALASPLLPANDRSLILRALAEVAYNGKQYAKSAERIQQYLAAGGNDATLRELLPQALYLAQDYAAAAKAFAAQVAADTTAGRQPSEKILRLLASANTQAKDDAGYVAALERLAVLYPKPEYWNELISRAAQGGAMPDRLYLDVYRLKSAALGGLADKEVLNYASLALRAGFPAEAAAALERGLATKALTVAANVAEASKLRDQAARAAMQDKAQETENEASAKAAKDGEALVNLGFAVALDGRADQGLSLMEQGLAKGGLKSSEEARLHLAIAQWRAGRGDAALKTFQALAGAEGHPRGLKSLARVWGLYLQSGAKPAA